MLVGEGDPQIAVQKATEIISRKDGLALSEGLKKGDFLPHHRDVHSGFSLLSMAVSKGWDEGATLLLEAGAKVNREDYDGETAAFVAAKRNHLSCLKILVEHGADLHHKNAYGKTLVFGAVSRGCEEVVTWLLAYDPCFAQAFTEFHGTPAHGMLRIWNETNEQDALWQQRCLRVLTLLLDAGMPADAAIIDGDTMLHDAARSGAAEAVVVLLNRLPVTALFCANKKGETPWELAEKSAIPAVFEACQKAHVNHQTLVLHNENHGRKDVNVPKRSGPSRL